MGGGVGGVDVEVDIALVLLLSLIAAGVARS